MKYVERREALAHCRILDSTDYRILLIEAQAGQGKTVLVSQYAERADIPSDWIFCDSQDADPILLLEKLLAAIRRQAPAFDDDAVRQTAYRTPITPETLGIVLSRLRHELVAAPGPWVLVVDDAHLLQHSPMALGLLRALPGIMDQGIRLVFVSRFPLFLDGERVFPLSKSIVIDNELLAFSHEEIAELFAEVLHKPVGTSDIRRLRRETDGWAAGLMMLSQETGAGGRRRTASADFMAYFSRQLLYSVDRGIREELQLAALLSEIPVDFAIEHFTSGLTDWLEQLCGKNLFVKAQGGTEATYRLHHLFQDALRRSCAAELSAARRRDFLTTAATWLEGQGQLEKALQLLIEAEDWARLDATLSRVGAQLISRARYQTLFGLLQSVPEIHIEDSGWISFILGWTSLHIAPTQSLNRITAAVRLLRDAGEILGEMMALSLLITYVVVADNLFARRRWAVHRLTELFERHAPSLPPSLAAFCAHSLIVGNAYILSDFQAADRLLPRMDINAGTGVDSCYGVTVLAAFQGDIATAHRRIERFFPSVNAPWSTPMERMAGSILKANFLHMSGDFLNFRSLKREVEAAHGNGISELTLTLTVWELDALVSEDRAAEAVAVADAFLAHPALAHNKHVSCQYRQYRTMALALLGRHDEALAEGLRSLRLRAEAGSRYFRVQNRACVGAALALGPRAETGVRMLHAALHLARRIDDVYIRPVVHGHLAAHGLRRGDTGEALAHLAEMAALMRKYGNRHGFGWSDATLLPAFQEAVRRNIDPPLFRELARAKNHMAILDDGTAIPLLRVRVCGPVAVSFGEEEDGPALSPLMQRLLAALGTAPGLALPVESVLARLWPEDPPEKGRNSLDRLLHRLRAALRDCRGAGPAREYFVLRRETLRLAHCDVDAVEGLRNARQGLRLAAEGQPWQAHCAFERMDDRLNGLVAVPDSLRPELLDAATCWIGIMHDAHLDERALRVARLALDFAPLDHRLQRLRHALLTALGRPGEAAQSLREYRNVLAQHEFSDKEIDLAIDSLLSGPDRSGNT